MGCLAVGHFSPAITTVKASIHNNNNNNNNSSNNSPPNPSRKRAPGMRRINGGPSPPKPKQQPSILEVERAIGGGIFRDQDEPRPDGGSTFYDLLSRTPIGQPEGSAEKKLREAGEWIVERTENGSSSGQEILMLVCLKILPLWLFFLLVASGVVQLPFNIPFLDDFLV